MLIRRYASRPFSVHCNLLDARHTIPKRGSLRVHARFTRESARSVPLTSYHFLQLSPLPTPSVFLVYRYNFARLVFIEPMLVAAVFTSSFFTSTAHTQAVNQDPLATSYKRRYDISIFLTPFPHNVLQPWS